MKKHILTYNQLNESNEFDDLSIEEVGRLADLGLLSDDLLKIYDYVKNYKNPETEYESIKIVRSLYQYKSELTTLPSWLKVVSGDLNTAYSKIEDIPDSLVLLRGIYAANSNLKEFRRTQVDGYLDLSYTKITKLPDNLRVDGYLSVEGVQFEQFPKSLEINGDLYIKGSNLVLLSNYKIRKMYKMGGRIYRN